MRKVIVFWCSALLAGCSIPPQQPPAVVNEAGGVPAPVQSVEPVVGAQARADFDAAIAPLRPVIPDMMGAMGSLN